MKIENGNNDKLFNNLKNAILNDKEVDDKLIIDACNQFVEHKNFRLFNDLVVTKAKKLYYKANFKEASKWLEYSLDKLKANEVNLRNIYCDVYNHFGVMYFFKGSFYESIQFFHLSLYYSTPKQSVFITNNIGDALVKLKFYSDALKFYERAQYLINKYDNNNLIRYSFVFINKAAALCHLNKIKKAKNGIENFKSIYENAGEEISIERQIQILVLTSLLFNKEDKIKESLKLLNEAKNLAIKHNLIHAEIQLTVKIANSIRNKGQLDLYIKEMHNALDIANKNNFLFDKKECLADLIETYNESGNIEMAQKLSFQYFKLLKEKDLKNDISGIHHILNEQEYQHKQFKKTNKILLQQTADLSEFAYITSHQLKEPIRNISGFSHLILKGDFSNNDKDKIEFQSYIKQNVSAVSLLLDNLEDYISIKRNKNNIIEINLNKEIEKIYNNLRNKYESKSIKIDYKELPLVKMELNHLRIVFDGLLSNAVKFSTEKVAISIKCEINNSHYNFIIADNGIGIDEKYQNKIFKLFHSLNRDEKHTVSGYDLARIKKIINLYDGRIEVESKLGIGSKFKFELPILY